MKFVEMIKHIVKNSSYEVQSRQCIEEMSELTKALNKFWRKQLDCGKKNICMVPLGTPEDNDIIEEIADVQIMLWQMQMFHGVSHEKLQMKVNEKLERQMRRINGVE